jgi:hypothetical protein
VWLAGAACDLGVLNESVLLYVLPEVGESRRCH